MPAMQVSPSASLLQALSGVMPAKRPAPPAAVAQIAPVTPKPEASARSDLPGQGAKPPVPNGRMGQIVDIRI